MRRAILSGRTARGAAHEKERQVAVELKPGSGLRPVVCDIELRLGGATPLPSSD